MTKRMNIACASNEKYLRYTYTMLTSLLENNRDSHVHVYFLFGDIKEDKLSIFEELEKNYDVSIECCQITEDMISSKLPCNKEWTIEVYYRLALGDLLPLSEDRVLYLDVDMIIHKNLQDFYFQDFEGKALVACPDMSALDGLTGTQAQLFAPMLSDPFFQYFNSGMVLFNLDWIRQEGIFLKQYMDIALTIPLTAVDQDLLNFVYYGKVKYADYHIYNLFAKQAFNSGRHYDDLKATVAILHFAGRKPWSGEGIRYDVEKLWWDYARKTPFYVEFLEELLYNEMESNFIEQEMRKMQNEKSKLMGLLQKCAEELNKQGSL